MKYVLSKVKNIPSIPAYALHKTRMTADHSFTGSELLVSFYFAPASSRLKTFVGNKTETPWNCHPGVLVWFVLLLFILLEGNR